MTITPLMQATIVDALKGLFQQSTQIAEQYMKGKMGTAAGFDWYMDQNIATHTFGTRVAAVPEVNLAGQTGSSLVTDGWTAADVLNEGDVFTIEGVFQVNAQSRLSTGQLQQFVVTAQATADGGGNMTIPISPAIVTSGAFQTVTGSPANNADLFIFGGSAVQSPQALALHRDAITFASADLPLPRGVDMAGRAADKQLGVSLRMVRAYDINTDNFPMRIEVLYGMAVMRPELGCRVAG